MNLYLLVFVLIDSIKLFSNLACLLTISQMILSCPDPVLSEKKSLDGIFNLIDTNLKFGTCTEFWKSKFDQLVGCPQWYSTATAIEVYSKLVTGMITCFIPIIWPFKKIGRHRKMGQALHFSEITGLCWIKWHSETLENVPYFWNLKAHVYISMYGFFPFLYVFLQ